MRPLYRPGVADSNEREEEKMRPCTQVSTLSPVANCARSGRKRGTERTRVGVDDTRDNLQPGKEREANGSVSRGF